MYQTISTSKGKYRYRFVPIFEGFKLIDKKIANENLQLLKRICERNQLQFILMFGTLLGAVREHDFIDHDEDIDLVMDKKDLPAFLDMLFELRENGFEMARYERRGFLSIIRKGEYIDIYFFQPYPEDSELRYCCQDICEKRFVEELAPVFQHYYQIISQNREEVGLSYVSEPRIWLRKTMRSIWSTSMVKTGERR